MLNADPATDWSKVDIQALHQHLVDMDNLTLRAQVLAEPMPTGARFTVTSPDASVEGSIRRMVRAHAATMNGANGWTLTPQETAGGMVLEVSGLAGDAAKINGLGFIGVMTLGMHHQAHYLMIAKGMKPHQQAWVPASALDLSSPNRDAAICPRAYLRGPSKGCLGDRRPWQGSHRGR